MLMWHWIGCLWLHIWTEEGGFPGDGIMVLDVDDDNLVDVGGWGPPAFFNEITDAHKWLFALYWGMRVDRGRTSDAQHERSLIA